MARLLTRDEIFKLVDMQTAAHLLERAFQQRDEGWEKIT